MGIFEFLAPGFLSPEMKPRKMGRTVSDYVLRRTKDQVLSRPAAEAVPRRQLELTPEQRESYRLAEEEGVVRLTEMGEAATIQHVFELVLRLKQICNFDSGHRRQLEAGTAGGRPGRDRRQRPQGDRLQPMGGHAPAAGRGPASGSARWSITARSRSAAATP